MNPGARKCSSSAIFLTNSSSLSPARSAASFFLLLPVPDIGLACTIMQGDRLPPGVASNEPIEPADHREKPGAGDRACGVDPARAGGRGCGLEPRPDRATGEARALDGAAHRCVAADREARDRRVA